MAYTILASAYCLLIPLVVAGTREILKTAQFSKFETFLPDTLDVFVMGGMKAGRETIAEVEILTIKDDEGDLSEGSQEQARYLLGN